MGTFRRIRFAVTLLILFMALFVSAETTFLNNVQAVGLTLTPSSGPVGTDVKIEITGGTLTTSTTCTISSTTNPSVVTFSGCVYSPSTGNGNGTFIVGNVPPGDYVIRVTGNSGAFLEQIFTVTYGARLQLFPSLGPTGTHVIINGSQFLPSDTTCSISSPTSASIIVNPACAIAPPVLGGTPSHLELSNRTTGSFYVGNVPIGQYVIRVTGSPGGDFAEAVFNVTRGPQLILRPSRGPTGTHVGISGGFFLTSDTTCSITSPTLSSIIQGAACSVFPPNAGDPGFGHGLNVTGSFTVGNVLPGQYVIQVTGNLGDFAQAIFNVTRGPIIQLAVSPAPLIFTPVGQITSGPVGIHVNIQGTYFLFSDTSCSISSPTSSSLITASACTLFIPSSGPFVGFENVTGSFTVGNVLPGQYVVQVTGSGGDFAQAIFNVTLGPRITLSPATGRPGTHVAVNGTGFLPTDTSCTISSPGSSSVLGGTQACVIRAGTGIISGSFTIGNVLPGQYIIQVNGNQGDFAQALLNVTSGPHIGLSPATGLPGIHVNVNGTGFLPTDTSCTISSPGSSAVLSGSQACVTTVGTGVVSGSFLIGNVLPGQYIIQVNGNGGDFAQAILNVTQVAPLFTLFPTNATNGATVTFRVTGLSPGDTGCTVQAVGFGTVLNTLLITSPSCSIASPSVATGSFVVGPYATTNVPWVVQVRGIPFNDIVPQNFVNNFNVTASIIVTPSSGTRNTVFTFTGSGFSSTATSCQAHIYPPFPTVPPTLPPACYVSTSLGQVAGSVITPGSVVSGTYAINVGDNRGHNATGFFTIGTPTALIVLTPATVAQGQVVAVAGTGFNPNNTFCVLTSGGSTGTPPWAVAPICSISGGYASAAFTVSNTANGGYYLITLTGWGDFHKNNVTGGDFASNFLGVNLASTVTTFSTTSTTATSTSTLSTTTTSVATSYTYFSTTYSTTGLFVTTYSHTAVNTVSGITQTTVTLSTSTSQTMTTVTVTTTTAFTTVSCGLFPCGYAVHSQGINSGPFADNIGLFAVLLLILPMLLRRLFS